MRRVLLRALVWLLAAFAALLSLGFGEISLASGRYTGVIICSVIAALVAAALAWAGCSRLSKPLRSIARLLLVVVALVWVADQLSRLMYM